MLQSILKRRFGKLDEKVLARETELSLSSATSPSVKHGIVCGGMAHQRLKQHIDLSVSRLATYKAHPNAMQVDAVHVSGGQERQGGSGNAQRGKGQGGNSVRGKGKESDKNKEKDEKQAGKFEGVCKCCKKKEHKKQECKRIQADFAASRCDKSGKPTSGTQPQAMHRARLDPESRWQSIAAANRNLVHQHDRTSPADSTGRTIGRRGVRSVGFWILLDILSDQLRRRPATAANTRQSSDSEQRYRKQRGVLWSETRLDRYRLEKREPLCGDMARHECDEPGYLH